MPGRASAIVGHGEEAILAVWTYSRVADRTCGIKRIYMVAKLAGRFVERYAHQGILQRLQILRA